MSDTNLKRIRLDLISQDLDGNIILHFEDGSSCKPANIQEYNSIRHQGYKEVAFQEPTDRYHDPYISGADARFTYGSGSQTLTNKTISNIYYDPAAYSQAIMSDTMKAKAKVLEDLLKETFGQKFTVSQFDADEGIVHLTWHPEGSGTNEHGVLSLKDDAKTTVTVFQNLPSSPVAWNQIFRFLRLYIANIESALYLIKILDWDGDFQALLELYPDVQIRFDAFKKQWNAKLANSSNQGPALFDRYDDNLYKTVCEVVSDDLLFGKYLENYANPEFADENNLDLFYDWKKYAIQTL